MAVKTSCLRFLFIDEIEASGCQLLNDLEERVSRNHNSRYKYSVGSTYPRPFAGINVLLFGDFWQPPPVGQVAVMQNPFADNALESAGVQHILQMIWKSQHLSALQPWRVSDTSSRVLHLSVNKRSGADRWFLRF